MSEERSYSQYGQDVIVDKVLNRLRNGVFIDVGAHDGITLSNSYFFEKHRQWTGVCIEPADRPYNLLSQNRPNVIAVKKVAYNDTKPRVQFQEISGYCQMLSGVEENYDERHKSRIQKEMRHVGGSLETVQRETVTLDAICKENDIKHVNYLSIDTEGSEIQVLQGLDFDIVKVDVVGVECNYAEDEKTITDFLLARGFSLHCKAGCDLLFVCP